MKKLMIFLLALFLMSFDSYSAEKSGFGVGVMLGEPTGLSFQKRAEREMYDFGLSYDLDDELTMIADYKVRFHQFDPQTSAYVGVGAFIEYYDHDHHHHHDHDYVEAGVRIPVGAEHMMAQHPFGFFVELAPTIELISDVDLGMMGAIGGRYYF